MLRKDSLQKTFLSVDPLVLNFEAVSLSPHQQPQYQVDNPASRQRQGDFLQHRKEYSESASGIGMKVLQGQLEEEREDQDLDKIVENHDASQDVAEPAYYSELVHKHEGYGRSSGDADGTDEQGPHQVHPSQKVEAGTDKKPCDPGLYQADAQRGPANLPDPCNVQFLADPECHYAQENENEEVERVHCLVEASAGSPENPQEVEEVRPTIAPPRSWPVTFDILSLVNSFPPR